MIDLSVSFGVVLEGGGARGAYQIGVWRAMEELGIKYNAVAGTSVGALNGAMMTMRDLDLALSIWGNMTFSRVLDVSDEVMSAFFKMNIRPSMVASYIRKIASFLKNRGISTEPLRDLLETAADEDRIVNSDVDLFFPAYCVTDKRGIEFYSKEMDKGALHDMLLASSCLPLFRRHTFKGKTYIDGGMYDSLPISMLTSRGYKNIIVIRLMSPGVKRKFNRSPDMNIIEIKPSKRLGSMMDFSGERSLKTMELGYNDAMRIFMDIKDDEE